MTDQPEAYAQVAEMLHQFDVDGHVVLEDEIGARNVHLVRAKTIVDALTRDHTAEPPDRSGPQPVSIGGIRNGSEVVVGLADTLERDQYGGAVIVTLFGHGGFSSLDLDPDGVRQLITALEATLAASTDDYNKAQAKDTE